MPYNVLEKYSYASTFPLTTFSTFLPFPAKVSEYFSPLSPVHCPAGFGTGYTPNVFLLPGVTSQKANKQTATQNLKSSNSPSPKSCLDQLVVRFHAPFLGLYVGILSSWSVCRSCVYCQNCYEFICSLILFNMEALLAWYYPPLLTLLIFCLFFCKAL